MDPSDAPASSGVMLAFLPTITDWCKIDLPHMTLVYAGTTDTRSPADFNALAKDAASVASLMAPFWLRNLGVAIFGDPPDQVNAFRLEPTTELWAARRFVEGWNASEHSFSPHVTIGPVTPFVDVSPGVIGFDRMIVAYGEENITFYLNQRRAY